MRRERVACEADRALRCGRHHDLLSELATRARTDPWDERVAAQLTRPHQPRRGVSNGTYLPHCPDRPIQQPDEANIRS
ncbi:hypothetical protein [Amycolatopsis sp. NPDC051128]|uniref:hypothetical protein n=1 Tax=Amycolatopsis sp. NPDC051128 TaxID=3155412 RepID=UPI00341A19A0